MKLERIVLMMLIGKLSLEEVEYKPFNEVCEYIRGITYNKSQEAKEENENNWKVLRANNIDLQRKVLDLRDVKEVDSSVKVKESQRLRKNDILICAGSGSKEHIGKVAFITEDMDYTFGGFMAVIRVISEKINSRFLFHILAGNLFSEFLAKKLNVSTINNLNSALIKNFQIPLPPLPIQQEIVRILDTFTNLTAELTAELTARRKQYEYYRDELLRFKNRKDIQWVPFGDYFEFKNGLNKGKEYFGSGNYIVNFTDVYKNRWLEKSMLKGRVQVEDKEVVAYSAQKGDVFFTRTSETREEIGMVSALVDDIDGCVFSGFVLRARPLSQNWLPKFCAYFFSTSFVRKEIIRYASFTTRALTSGPRLSKIKLPLLPIQEQEKIVDILDNFSSLCNGVEKGLPAEISARQKQYEYYRDQLLTFKRIGG